MHLLYGSGLLADRIGRADVTNYGPAARRRRRTLESATQSLIGRNRQPHRVGDRCLETIVAFRSVWKKPMRSERHAARGDYEIARFELLDVSAGATEAKDSIHGHTRAADRFRSECRHGARCVYHSGAHGHDLNAGGADNPTHPAPCTVAQVERTLDDGALQKPLGVLALLLDRAAHDEALRNHRERQSFRRVREEVGWSTHAGGPFGVLLNPFQVLELSRLRAVAM
jgi:hypothetical protein